MTLRKSILIVGDKPSAKNVDPKIPFVGTQSYKRLLEWIWKMDIDISDVTMMNRVEFVEEMESSLSRAILLEYHVIALGNEAEKCVKTHGRIFLENMSILPNYFKLPHPSGLNRKLNDQKFVEKELKRCKEWLDS